MVVLTFAEQVKLVLSRRNMTIKQLAEEIQEATGMKMSRQNLTQRLSRDNFQEQDMRMIAEILGCKLQLTILDDAVIEMKSAEELSEESLVEEIIEELIEEEFIEEAVEELVEEVEEVEEVDTEEVIEEEAVQETFIKETIKDEVIEEVVAEFIQEEKQQTVAPEKVVERVREVTMGEFGVGKEPERQRRSKKTADGVGEVNPYTLREYDNNTVRSHPKRIGYVQVYDREQHGWVEMTEWAYLAYQERQKRMLGKNYQEPIFLD